MFVKNDSSEEKSYVMQAPEPFSPNYVNNNFLLLVQMGILQFRRSSIHSNPPLTV
jgi:hypothetical protein